MPDPEQAIPPQGTSASLFRAVSVEEANDLRASRRFRAVPHSFEGKLFATTREDAIWWGEILYSSLNKPFRVVEVKLDRSYLDTLPLVDPKPDGRPAIHIDRERLQEFNVTFAQILERDVP